MSRDRIPLIVQRKTRTSNGAGGYIESSPVQIYPVNNLLPLMGNIRYKPFKKKYTRVEAGSKNSTGPGLSTISVPFAVIFARDNNNVLPVIKINDLIIANGKTYKVFLPRYYERTLQCDLELQE